MSRFEFFSPYGFERILSFVLLHSQSTTWVRKESEAEAKRQEEAGPVKGKIGFNFNNPMAGKSLPKWMMKGGKSDDIEKEGIEHNDRAENRNAVGLKPLKSWFRLPRGGCF